MKLSDFLSIWDNLLPEDLDPCYEGHTFEDGVCFECGEVATEPYCSLTCSYELCGHCGDECEGLIYPKGVTMTDQQIIDLFDSSNITLADLAMQSGCSVKELKVLLMGEETPSKG